MQVIKSPSIWRWIIVWASGFFFMTLWQSLVLGQETIIGLQCATSCSVEKPGIAIASLRWDSAKLQNSHIRLDWTVYKNGFRDNAFASFMQLAPQLEPRPSFTTAAIRKIRPYQLRLNRIENATDERIISGVIVENIEPGINYSYRLQFERNGRRLISETVKCTAPVCVIDEER